MGLIQALHSKKGKKFMGYLYGWGASIVIIGAMFKIQHWPGAGPMLVGGLSIEAIIFFFSAFEPIHEETDWSLVYPELRGMHDEDGGGHGHGAAHKISKSDPVAQELDKMLAEAKIGPELIESLGSGMKSLSEQAAKMNNITDASVATQGFVETVKDATKNMSDMSQGYIKATASLSELAISNVDGQSYGEQLKQVSKNLGALNAVYELQLQSSSEHMKATSRLFDGIESMVQNLQDSVNDTARYKDEIGKLAHNLGALNTIYGNMLSAMNFNR
jgi:gliding motility-associated protein GldL